MLHHHSENAKDPSLLISVSGGGVRFRHITTTYPGLPPVRGPIGGLSESSVGRMRRYLRGCTAQYRYMVTLTYPGEYSRSGRVVKDHLRRFLQESKRYAQRDYLNGGEHPATWSSFWFLEFQSRGAPHFHIFTTHPIPKDWASHLWYRIVGSDDIRHLHAGTRVETLRAGRGGTISYAMKYAAKAEQKVVPEGYESVGRFWGVAGLRTVVAAAIIIRTKEVGARTAARLRKLKETIFDLEKSGRAKRIMVNGVCRGFIIPCISDQVDLCRHLSVVAAYAKAESGGYNYFPYEAFPEREMELIDVDFGV